MVSSIIYPNSQVEARTWAPRLERLPTPHFEAGVPAGFPINLDSWAGSSAMFRRGLHLGPKLPRPDEKCHGDIVLAKPSGLHGRGLGSNCDLYPARLQG